MPTMKQTKEQLMAEVREQNKLFDAAPDLLAALENLSAVAQGMKILLGDKFTGTERFFEEARAAIAKAKAGKE